MKKILFLTCLLLSAAVFAQGPNAEQKKMLFGKVDSIVYNYVKLSALSNGGENITDAAIRRFRDLFLPTATLPDEMNPAYFYGDKQNPTAIRTISITDYLGKIKESNPQGFIVNLLNANVNYKNLSQDIEVVLRKRIRGNTRNGLFLINEDTVLLNLRVAPDYSNVKIASVTLLGSSLIADNDKDNDFVADAEDKCPGVRGLYTTNGCLSEAELQAIAAEKKRIADSIHLAHIRFKLSQPPHWWITAGLTAGTTSNNLTQSDFGKNYQNSIASREHNPAATFKSGTAIGGFVHLEHFFGPKATFGIGSGIAFSSVSGTLNKDSFHIEYQATDKWGLAYRQIISSRGAIEEKVKMSTVSVPLMLIIKGGGAKKLGFRIEGGLLYNLSANTSMSSTNAAFDYEAVYNYTGDKSSVYDNSPNPSPNAFLITKAHAAKHGGNVDAYFSEMKARGYNVGLNQTAGGQTSDAEWKGSIGFTFRPSVALKVNQDFHVNLGVYYTSLSFKNDAPGYRLINEQMQYNTLLNSYSKVSNSSYGISLSITHSLFYPRKKWTSELSSSR